MVRSRIRFPHLLITLVITLSACNLPFTSTVTPTEVVRVATEAALEDSQVTALRQLEAASETPPDLYFQNGFPRFVSGSFVVEGNDVVERARNFLETNQDLYRIANPNLELAVRRVNEAETETDVVFYQSYKGLEVFGSEIVVTLSGERVYATVGGLLNGDLTLEITPTFSALQAEESARADLELPEAIVVGTTTIMLFDQSLLDDVPPEAHLVWRVTISDPAPYQVFVDAQTGLVLFKYSLAQDGSGLTDYDFGEFTTSGGSYRDCYYLSNTLIGDEDGLVRRLFPDPEAAAIWWFARNTYQFYHDTFGRHSYDDDGSQFEVFIRGGVDNAAWISGCDLATFNAGWVAQDVVTHEFTHGVINATSGLLYFRQSGALNESYADVMATLQDGNWTIGEGRIGGVGSIIRDLSNPPAFSHPDRMSNYNMTSLDAGGVHTNSGIPNKAAFLIAVGQAFNGRTITGIGNAKLGTLAYAAMTRLGSSAQFIDARNLNVRLAESWGAAGTNGFTPFDACQVQNAYTAVELGEGDIDCDGTDDTTDLDDDLDYIPDSLDNCPSLANPGQQYTDTDGQGDACDDDQDNDTVSDDVDNCPLVVNTKQQDRDGDGLGDICDDGDGDGDGVIDFRDNCPLIANPDQRNSDWSADLLGNACDTDDDNDTIPDDSDNCPLINNNDQTDRDGDGAGDPCDNSPDAANPDQADSDGDGFGDVSDNCPLVANARQEDVDRDGLGDHCDGTNPFTLLPDGSLTDLSIRGGPGQVRSMPIPTCTPKNCPDWIPSDYLVRLVLTCPASNVGIWVTDETGNMADRSPYLGDLRVLRFHPVGGRSYFLNFVFGQDFVAGSLLACTGSMSSGSADEQPNPTPDGPTSTPLSPPPLPSENGITVTPENLPNLTPTSTPTAPATNSTLTFTIDVFCRLGPSSAYKEIATFFKGQIVQIEGRNQNEPRWWWILIPNSGSHCWVSGSTGSTSGLLDNVPVIVPPPLPPTPTPSAIPTIAAPAAPELNVSNQVCTAFSYVVRLSWKDVANETGYRVYRDGALIATLGAGVVSYDDTSPNYLSHSYRVEAFNGTGANSSPTRNSAGCVY